MAMSTEKKVGLFFLATMIALAVMIELVEEWRPFEVQHDYKAYFKAAVGINAGDPVRMAGVEVGKIRTISIDDSRVRIDFYVVKGTRIKEDTIAMIRQTNLLGGQFLGLDFGSEQSRELPPGSTVQSREGANIDQLITNLDRNQERVFGTLGEMLEESREPFVDSITQFESIVRKIDQGEGTLGKMVNDPGMYDEVQGSAAELKEILARIESGEGSLGRLLNDPALYDEATRSLANLREISDRVKSGEGTVGRLVNDDALYTRTSDAMANIREISDKANRGTGTFGKLVNDDELYQQTSDAMTRLNSIAGKIDEGKGTMGRLVNEDDLYRDAKTTLHKVEKTVDGLSDQGPISALGIVVGTLF
jgi:phospholipid/cholesterol/gamma-HCH transport system substrate-binding protein